MTSNVTDRLNGFTASAAVKTPVSAATTSNITLSGEKTIDGVSITSGDRVLVKDQTDNTENGIYVASTGSWSRAPDFDGSRDVLTGTLVLVAGGTSNGPPSNILFRVSTSGDPSPGEAIEFASISVQSAGGALENIVEDTSPQLGGSLDVNGNSIVSTSNGDINITPDGTGNVVIGGSLDVNGNSIVSTSNGDINITPDGTGNVVAGNFTLNADQTVGAGQDNYVLTYDHSAGEIGLEAAASGATWTYGSSVATTSGSSVTIASGISGAREVEVFFDEVSETSGTIILLQIGDSGGIETSGYTGGADADGETPNNSSTGWKIVGAAHSNDLLSGVIRLALKDDSTQWGMSGLLYNNFGASDEVHYSAGLKTLSASLESIQISVSSGAFDNGSVQARWR